MTVLVTRGGLQTTIQAAPRKGLRQFGVPASGPADALAMGLANHLVGNELLAPALETTLTGVGLRFEADGWFAVTGAPAEVTLNGTAIEAYTCYRARESDELQVDGAAAGARSYVALAGGLAADNILGSCATYLPAGLGGYNGKALEDGDRIDVLPFAKVPAEARTPDEFRPPVSASWALRACGGADVDTLSPASLAALFDTNFVVGNRADRMGLQLDGTRLEVTSGGKLPSAPVMPGCVQCPEDGTPFLLSVDAQTTGGYPRVAQVVRADRHLLGQLRPGAHLRFLERTAEQANRELREKHDYWRRWLPDVGRVI